MSSRAQGEAPTSEAPSGTIGAVVRLAVVVGGGVLLAVFLHAVPVLVVVLAIVTMIMLHELGHFIAAKASGMKVTEYFFGFGPRLWSIRRGETEYGVKALPAGGYVRITGMTMLEEVDAADEPRSYRQASFPRRLAVAVAGSTMHMLIALALCWSLFVFIGATVATSPYVVGLIHFLHRETPAELAGLKAGDRFVSIDGRSIHTFTQLENEVGEHAGRLLHVVVERHGRLLSLSLRPVSDKGIVEVFDGQRVAPSRAKPTGVIGVELSSGRYAHVDPFAAIPRAFAEFGSLVAATGDGIAQVFSFHGLGQFAHSVVSAGHEKASGAGGSGAAAERGTSVMSILGVIQVGSQAASTDPGELLVLLALVNIFVGLVNLFPMLPLDGGHVAIALYERIRSRRGRQYHADVLKLMPFAYVFLAFIVVLGLSALYANIVQPVHLPGG